MTNLWHDIKRGSCEKLNVIVECSKGSRVKYEVDKESGLIKFDRVLYSPMHYSTNYGFVPRTLWEDSDPLDVLILTEEALVPGCLVVCRPIAVLDMIDSGEGDSKILAVPIKDPRFNHIENLEDISPHLILEIKEFFSVYKNLQGKKVEVKNWEGKDEAFVVIKKSFDMYDKKFSNKKN